MNNYIETNKSAWEKRTAIHILSEMYNFEEFMQGESSVPPLDYELLGDLSGKSLLHLQCHFGMDTLSIARKYALERIVGIDLAESAIDKAKELNQVLGLNAEFVASNIYDLPDNLSGKFDVVYTSYGVLSWLGDLEKWGEVISSFLKPGGRFVIVEFHPILWMLGDGLITLEYAYSRDEPFVSVEGTYTENGVGSLSKTVNWNYGISEPVNALISNGLRITGLNEYYHSPVNLFGKMVRTGDSEYKLKGLEDIVPLLYSLTAEK